MTQTTIVHADSARQTLQANVKDGRRLRWRHLWLVPGLAIAIYANQLGNANGVGILALIAFGLVPDIPRLLGARGRPIHSLLHQPALPIAAIAIAAVAIAVMGPVGIVWLVGAVVWLSHVVIGWAVGDVPRRGGAPRDG